MPPETSRRLASRVVQEDLRGRATHSTHVTPSCLDHGFAALILREGPDSPCCSSPVTRVRGDRNERIRIAPKTLRTLRLSVAISVVISELQRKRRDAVARTLARPTRAGRTKLSAQAHSSASRKVV